MVSGEMDVIHIGQNANSRYARIVAPNKNVQGRCTKYVIKNQGTPLSGWKQFTCARFHEEFHRLFPRLWRVYKQSRLLRIASVVAAVPLVLILCGIIYISYNRVDLPDLDAFIRFEPPTMGHIYDANGNVLIALGRERREIIQYKDVPDVLRQAILSAEDENFFSHAGVDFSVFPRMLGKTNVHALFAHVGGTGGENAAEHAQVFPQGGLPAQRWAWQDRFYERVKNVCRKHGSNCAQK